MKKDTIRLNEEITAPEVRVIGENGEQIGIMSPKKALELAEEAELDLVEIAPNANPPVCRIMDYGKYKYRLSKKEKQSKKKQHVIHIKEIRFRPTIDDHDIEVKLKQARKFLGAGNHVKVRILYRGRQVVHPELGEDVLKRITQQIEDISTLEGAPLFDKKSITATFIPK